MEMHLDSHQASSTNPTLTSFYSPHIPINFLHILSPPAWGSILPWPIHQPICISLGCGRKPEDVLEDHMVINKMYTPHRQHQMLWLNQDYWSNTATAPAAVHCATPFIQVPASTTTMLPITMATITTTSTEFSLKESPENNLSSQHPKCYVMWRMHSLLAALKPLTSINKKGSARDEYEHCLFWVTRLPGTEIYRCDTLWSSSSS